MPENVKRDGIAADALPQAHGDVSAGRRRLLRGAAGSAPILLTLHGRPVLAQTCATASASASLNPSGIERAKASGSAITCNGQNPDWWATNTTSWPGDIATGTKFNLIFEPD